MVDGVAEGATARHYYSILDRGGSASGCQQDTSRNDLALHMRDSDAEQWVPNPNGEGGRAIARVLHLVQIGFCLCPCVRVSVCLCVCVSEMTKERFIQASRKSRSKRKAASVRSW